MAGVDVVAQHGWGFGAWCWDRWRDVLPAGFALHCPDRGYFGPAVAVAAQPRIVLVHSLGLHLLSPQLWAAELIVVLSGFRSFHSPCARQARRSRRTVEQMLARLEREPAALLADFYARCGAPSDNRWSGLLMPTACAAICNCCRRACWNSPRYRPQHRCSFCTAIAITWCR